MTKADEYYYEKSKQILGWKGRDVDKTRAEWSDGTKAGTKAIFADVSNYDLGKEFPITTLRKQYWKNAIKEMLWIHQKHSNNVKELGLKIWDQWADEDGSIGKSYGYQAGKVFQWADTPLPMTQIERVIYLLEHEPNSRRIHITLRNNDDVKEKALEECAHTVEFCVLDGKLNMVLIQRSGDFLTASGPGGYNEIQYAALQFALAHVSELEVGEFSHLVTNQHIYDKHIPEVKELIEICESMSITPTFPKLKINTEEKDFFKLKVEDFEMLNYKPIERTVKFEVAK